MLILLRVWFLRLVCVIGLSCSTLGCAVAPFAAAGSVGAGTATHVAGSSISLGKQLDDQIIKSKIINTLMQKPKAQSMQTNIGVTVFNGSVLLLGQVPTDTMKTQLAKYIATIPGVKVIYNQLQVGPKQSVGSFVNDAWITTKVKSNMLGHINPLRFKVVTERATVYLLGQVTQAQADKASQIAAHTKGVRQVVNVLTITKAKPTDTADPPHSHHNPSANTLTTTANTHHATMDDSHNQKYHVGSAASD